MPGLIGAENQCLTRNVVFDEGLLDEGVGFRAKFPSQPRKELLV